MEKVLKVVGLSVSVLVVVLVVGYVYLVWKLNHPPKRPEVMPESAIWIEAPALPIQFAYRGEWLGCWTITGIGVQCAITDWDGKPEYGDAYVPCDDPKRAVEEAALKFAPMDWENTYGGVISTGQTDEVYRIAVVRLTDGTTLLPLSDYDHTKEYLNRASRNFPSLGCRAVTITPRGRDVGTNTASETSFSNASPLLAGVDGIGYPKCIYCPNPRYSEEARSAGTEGIAVLELVIQPNGKPTNIDVVRSLSQSLDESAVDTVRQWRFKPALNREGIPVATTTKIEVTFRLR
jgi:TonB family protein